MATTPGNWTPPPAPAGPPYGPVPPPAGPSYGPVPPTAPVPGYPPVPARKKGLGAGAIAAIVIGAVVLVCGAGVGILAVAGLGFRSRPISSSVGGQLARDITITTCGATDSGTYHATLTVTNHGSSTTSYMITIAFTSQDESRQFDTAVTFVNDLAPGQSASKEAISFKDAVSSFKCKLSSVTTT
jgi:hypothetical protein